MVVVTLDSEIFIVLKDLPGKEFSNSIFQYLLNDLESIVDQTYEIEAITLYVEPIAEVVISIPL